MAETSPAPRAPGVTVVQPGDGRAGELCELTEVGAVLVGGGELHEELESLCRVEQPLSRGIERFTGAPFHRQLTPDPGSAAAARSSRR